MQDYYITYQFPVATGPVAGSLLPYAHASGVLKKKEVAINAVRLAYTSLFNDDIHDDEITGFTCLVIGEPVLRHDEAFPGIPPGSRVSAAEAAKMHNRAGSAFIAKLKGNFSIVLASQKEDTLWLFNSRYGMSPLYYTVQNGCSHISSSLAAIRKSCACSPDEAGIVESVLFNYPLAEKTLLSGVNRLLPGEVVCFRNGVAERKFYFTAAAMFTLPPYTEEEVIAKGYTAFKNAMDSAMAGFDSLCASLTGGFDSRTILSFLGDKSASTRFYSFGISGSKNIDIPMQISNREHLDFMPVLLDSGYETDYTAFAKEAVMQSDCLRTIEAANYPYAFKKLSSHSPVVLTGICGSELLRPFQNLGLMVSPAWNELNTSSTVPDVWNKLHEGLKANSYLNADILNRGFDAVRNHVHHELLDAGNGLTQRQRFFAFVVSQALPRYFGGEIHAERAYARNRFPFLDDEFVEFVFRSPYSGVRANPVKPSANERFKSQFFYAKLIELTNKHLLYYPTDHGYPMHYVMDRYPLLRIALPFLLHTRKKRKTNYREFKPVEWAEIFYNDVKAEEFLNGGIVHERAKMAYAAGSWKADRAPFARITSLSYWFHGE